MSPAGFMID